MFPENDVQMLLNVVNGVRKRDGERDMQSLGLTRLPVSQSPTKQR
jgi:hypothetical protein